MVPMFQHGNWCMNLSSNTFEWWTNALSSWINSFGIYSLSTPSPLWCRHSNIRGELVQCHGCWCSGYTSIQVINSSGIHSVGYMGRSFPRRISTICAISILKNDEDYISSSSSYKHICIYLCLLLFISMLWLLNAGFEPGSLEPISSRLNARWQTDWAIQHQAKTWPNSPSLWSAGIQPTRPHCHLPFAPGSSDIHWGRVTHVCVDELTIIVWDNCLSPGRRQAIIWTNAGISLIGP